LDVEQVSSAERAVRAKRERKLRGLSESEAAPEMPFLSLALEDDDDVRG